MGAAIVAGSEVLIAAAARPRVGQIWAFCDDGGNVVVHRCRGRRDRSFVFEGDASGRADRPVPADRLIGRVVAVRHGGAHRNIGQMDTVRGTASVLARRARRAILRRPRR